MLTVVEAQEKLREKYPVWIANLVQVKDRGYYAVCERQGYTYKVSTCSFEHEMGHAVAKMLRIEKELGEKLMALPNAKSTTNENWLCYPAQHLAGMHFDKTNGYNSAYEEAVAEYAAEGIRAYTEGWAELPSEIREWIDERWK